jgi:hypothetical protein
MDTRISIQSMREKNENSKAHTFHLLDMFRENDREHHIFFPNENRNPNNHGKSGFIRTGGHWNQLCIGD